MKRVKIEIDGMTCSNCEKHVEKELARLGARKIKVSHFERNAMFSISDINPEVLKASIKAVGYKPGKVFIKEETGIMGRFFGK